jgi:hypothetical protein
MKEVYLFDFLNLNAILWGSHLFNNLLGYFFENFCALSIEEGFIPL